MTKELYYVVILSYYTPSFVTKSVELFYYDSYNLANVEMHKMLQQDKYKGFSGRIEMTHVTKD